MFIYNPGCQCKGYCGTKDGRVRRRHLCIVFFYFRLLCLVVVKEQARPMLKYYSLLCTGTGARRLIYSQNLPHIVIYFYSHDVYEFYWYYQSIAFTNLYFQSTRKDLFAQQESLSLLKIPKLPSIVYILDSHIRFLSNLQISLLRLLFSAV